MSARRGTLALCALAQLSCDGVTKVGEARLPPPERPAPIEEGHLVGGADRCGALLASPPIRVSASPGDAVGLKMATQTLEDGETIVGMVWIDEGPDPAVVARYLFADGVQLDPPDRYEVPTVRSVGIVAIDAVFAFGVGIVDASRITMFPAPSLLLPEEVQAVRIPVDGDFHDVSATALADKLLFATLGADEDGDGEGDSMVVIVLLLNLEPEHDSFETHLPASAVAIVAQEPGARLVWIHDGALYGAFVGEDVGWTVEALPAPAGGPEVVMGDLSVVSSRSSIYLPVADAEGLVSVFEQDRAGAWTSLTRLPSSGATDLSIALEEGGTRLAFASTTVPADGSPAEVRLVRASTTDAYEPCSTPTLCLDVTTDERASHEPVIAALRDGYAVAWTDDVGGQRDVFYTKVTCRAASLDDQ